MGIAVCHQGSFYCYVPLAEQQHLGFPLVSGSWPPKQCQALAPSYGKGLKPNQEWLGIPISFVPQLCQHVMQEGHCCRSKDLQIGWWLPFSGSVQMPFRTVGKSVEAEVLFRHLLDFPVFNEIYKCCPQQQGHTNSLQTVNNRLAITWGVLELPWGPFCL